MGFTQVTFLFVFLPVSILIYLAVYKISVKNIKVCNGVLLCESIVFFWLAEPKLLVFFVIITFLMYSLGLRVHNTASGRERKELIICSVTIFVVIPVVYKYLPALKVPFADVQLATLPIFSDVIAPLGISFFALEAISYIVDIYSDKAKPGNLIDAFVFMMLFPKTVCGPVVLWRDFRNQIYNRKTELYDVSEGLKRIVKGYAKKAILADTFATTIILIDSKISDGRTDIVSVWIIMLLYFFRIYYDFSGYSDIAIGLCRIFGFDIGENFDMPYLSGSLTDFWRRWHISLGRWFKEYIYLPLGGNRSGSMPCNILATFLIAGLWHGWRFTILLWALLNGILVTTEKLVYNKEWYKKIPFFIHVSSTALLVCLGWVLFSASDLSAAETIFKGLFISSAGSIPNFTWRFFMPKRIIVFLVIAMTDAFGGFQRLALLLKTKMNEVLYDTLESLLLLVLLAVVIMFVLGEDYTPFIYSLI